MNNSSNTSLKGPSEHQQGLGFDDIAQLAPIAVLILLTNGVVFLLFGKMRSLRTPANYLLLSLAISDAMTGLINIPLYLSLFWTTGKNSHGSVYCASEVFHNTISCSVAYHITAITIEKYVAVVNPLGRFLMTKKTVVKILSAVWLWSAFLGTIPVSWWSSWWNYTDPLADYLQAGHIIFCLVAVFFIPYMFILFAYSTMFTVVSSKRRLKKLLHQKDPRAFKKANNEKKCLIILLTMAIAFAVCWIPWFTLRLIYSLTDVGWIDVDWAFMEDASHIFMIVRYLSSAINPLLYTFFKQDFWSAFKVVVLKRRPRRPSATLSVRQTIRLQGSDQRVELLASGGNGKTEGTSV